MFFKNKIKKSIDKNAKETIETSLDFDSLGVVRKRQNERSILNRWLIRPYHESIVNIANKYHNSLAYVKNHRYHIFNFYFVVLLLVSFFLLAWTAFKPYYGTFPGDSLTPISNFYTINNGFYSFTALGIVDIVFAGLVIISSIFYFIFAFKNKQVIVNKTIFSKVLSIVFYVFIAISFCLVLVVNIIPPNLSTIPNNQITINLISQINDTQVEALKVPLIQELFRVNNIAFSGTTDQAFIEHFDKLVSNSYFAPSNNSDSLSLIYNVSFASQEYKLLTSGIIIIVLFAFFSFSAIIAIPIWMGILNINYNLNTQGITNEVKYEWNIFKRMIYAIVSRFKNFSIKNIKKIKEKDSFHKYKKHLDEKSINTKEQGFSTDVDNTSKNVIKQNITKKEIESHKPNEAFLNLDGKWMYHDGNGKYYYAKGDEWLVYDIESDVHKAHANIVDDSLDFSPSQKQIKEHKIKFGKVKSNIAIPDAELEDIMKNLDI